MPQTTAPTKSDGRTERSRRSRERVVGAATALFVELGYAGSTIEAIAARAGVSPQTVYYSFGTKRHLLAAVLDASVAGDLDPVPVLARPWVEAIRNATDPEVAVAALVGGCLAVVERAAPVYEVIRRASGDPDAATLLAENRAGRRAVQRSLVTILHAAGHLRPDLDLDTAADITYGLLNEEVHRFFVVDCGWSSERFLDWATATLSAQLR
jgi:AcrR family transcriptional regulator